MSKRRTSPAPEPSFLAPTIGQHQAWRMEPQQIAPPSKGQAAKTQQQLFLALHIQPGASHDQWQGWHGDALKLAIKAPPVDGKANHYLIAFLATEFGVRKSDVELRRGELNRHKQFVIQQPTRLPAALAALGLQL